MTKPLPSVSTCAPAWRLAVVTVYGLDDFGLPDFPDPVLRWGWDPVVTLLTTLYADPEPDRHPVSDTGWFSGTDLMVLDRELGAIRAHGSLDDHEFRNRVVVCTWPPEEDERRFSEIAEELGREMVAERRPIEAGA